MDNSAGKFSFRARLRSFAYAGKGIVALFLIAHNARIHAVAAILAIIAGFLFDISMLEWVAIIGCIVAVIAAEAVNSAVESLADAVSQQYNPLIGKAKDLAAAAVLILACGAVAIGLIIFLPYIFALL